MKPMRTAGMMVHWLVIWGLIMLGCRAFAPSGEPSVTETPPLPTRAAGETPPVETTTVEGQAAALLPEAQDDLASLGTVPRYTLDLRVDYAGHAFQGRASVIYTNAEPTTLEQIVFRLLPNGQRSYGDGSLIVSRVLLAGQPVAPEYSLEDTVMAVPLAEPLEPGEQILMEIDFQGEVPVDFGGTESPSGYGIYNYSDGVLALSGWYPILAVYDQDGWNLDQVSPIGDSVYSDTALYTVTVALEAELTVVGTGVVVDQEENAGQRTHRFAGGPVRDFFLVISPDFQVASRQVGGVEVNSYYLPGQQEGGEMALSISADSLDIFNRRFGPYPFQELDIVAAPMRNALGVEYPGIMLVAAGLYDDPENPSFVVTTAHEVAHQWWYSVVGNDVFEEPWLDETLATYFSSLYYAEVVGPQAYHGFTEYWEQRYAALVEEGLDDQITQNLAHFEALPNRSVYGGVVYTKGALFFKALREEIGDQAFFSALQMYYVENKYQIGHGEALLAAFEAAAGRPLDDFYATWLSAP